MTSERLRHFWDGKLNDLLFSLTKTRQALADLQQRVGPKTAPLGQRVSQTLASLREQERTLAGIQQRVTYIQQRVGNDAALLGRVEEAVTALRESARTLADLRQRLSSVRRDTQHTSPPDEKEDV